MDARNFLVLDSLNLTRICVSITERERFHPDQVSLRLRRATNYFHSSLSSPCLNFLTLINLAAPTEQLWFNPKLIHPNREASHHQSKLHMYREAFTERHFLSGPSCSIRTLALACMHVA